MARLGASRWVGRGDQEGTVLSWSQPLWLQGLSIQVSLAPVCPMAATSGRALGFALALLWSMAQGEGGVRNRL